MIKLLGTLTPEIIPNETLIYACKGIEAKIYIAKVFIIGKR